MAPQLPDLTRGMRSSAAVTTHLYFPNLDVSGRKIKDVWVHLKGRVTKTESKQSFVFKTV